MPMPMPMTVPLDLPDVRVLAHRMLENGTVLIEVESTLRTTQCHRCGRDIDRFHGFDRPIRLRHLPVFGRQVVAEIRPKRYRCPYCEEGPTTTQRCAWHDPNRPHTTAFEQDVLKRLTQYGGRRQPAIWPEREGGGRPPGRVSGADGGLGHVFHIGDLGHR